MYNYSIKVQTGLYQMIQNPITFDSPCCAGTLLARPWGQSKFGRFPKFRIIRMEPPAWGRHGGKKKGLPGDGKSLYF